MIGPHRFVFCLTMKGISLHFVVQLYWTYAPKQTFRCVCFGSG
jgi:hypothetical protein